MRQSLPKKKIFNMTIIDTRNRLGFAILGMTNNFAFVIMLAAANDLLKTSESSQSQSTTASSDLNQTGIANHTKPYCNTHSTSTILLADTLPSLTTKFIYPFLLVGIQPGYKATVTALLSAAAFLITGLSTRLTFIFLGVICASASSGLGESTYLSRTPLYGDVALGGWAIGTGAAGLVGAFAYAIMKTFLSIETIMLIMLVIPLAMLISYNFIIIPNCNDNHNHGNNSTSTNPIPTARGLSLRLNSRLNENPLYSDEERKIETGVTGGQSDGGEHKPIKRYGITYNENDQADSKNSLASNNSEFDISAKLRYLPNLINYFLPLLLVYFGEYFINQGLYELIYIKSFSLDKDAQYRWFQVSYQLGVMLSRSSIELFRIKNIWTMSVLQLVNAIIFLLHTMKFYQIPNFGIVISLIIYEGLLGGFTYVNTFYRIKKEVEPSKQEFAISTVTMADSLGIVLAGLVALPVHDALCKLYR